MNTKKTKRVTRALTSGQKSRLRLNRAKITRELPELIASDQLRKEARDEPTLSGELRRAIHASECSLAELASSVDIPTLMIDEFLTGERTLRSDVMDRLTTKLGLVLAVGH